MVAPRLYAMTHVDNSLKIHATTKCVSLQLDLFRDKSLTTAIVQMQLLWQQQVVGQREHSRLVN